MKKTYEEMLESARSLFGDEVHVRMGDEGWVIETQVEEEFDKEPYKGTLAYDADSKYDSVYGTELMRWADDYGYSSSHRAEIYDLYDEHVLDVTFATAKRVLLIHRDAPEYWELTNCIEFRDRYLAYAEKHGIVLTDEDVHPLDRITPMEIVALAKAKEAKEAGEAAN